MSLENKLTGFAQAVGTDIKNLNTNQGSLSALNTTIKTSIVNAINEVITNTTTNINNAKAEVKADILGGADAAYDTLQEVKAFLQSNDSAISGLLSSIGTRIRYDASQTLNTTQQATACANIGVGNPEVDLLSIYNTAKA